MELLIVCFDALHQAEKVRINFVDTDGPWGIAFNRETYFNGLALLKMKDGSEIILDKNGQFAQKLPPPTQ